MSRKDPETNVSAQEERYCRLTLKGSQSDAYREAYPDRIDDDTTADDIAVRASKLSSRPAIKNRIRQLLDECKVTDLETVGSAYKQLCDLTDKATEAKNWTACAAFMRLKLQVLGMLQEHILLNTEQTITDEELIRRVAKDNPALAALLHKSVGNDNQFAA